MARGLNKIYCAHSSLQALMLTSYEDLNIFHKFIMPFNIAATFCRSKNHLSGFFCLAEKLDVLINMSS